MSTAEARALLEASKRAELVEFAPMAEDDADAVSKVSAFLSDSRFFAERAAKLCKHSGCAFLVTGVALAGPHCCRTCARTPGRHGPKCARRLLPCSRPGCAFAVTGLSAKHCCKMCARNGEHGPNCWCMPAGEEEEEDEAVDVADGAESQAGSIDGLACVPCKPVPAEGDDGGAVALAALAAQVEGNEEQIAANAAVIRTLRDAIEARSR